jgi:uncharacterized damage-inducible protein DinB
MNKEYFTELAGYTNWADNKAMEWLNHISDEQWEQVIVSSFSSIRQTAIHLASAQKIWIDFWNKAPAPVYLSAEFKGTKNELIDIWKKASAGLKDFMETYPEEKYSKQVTFRYPNGREGQLEFQQTFAHIVNHSTYHRGQLVTLLRQADFTQLSSTDLAAYYVVHQK